MNIRNPDHAARVLQFQQSQQIDRNPGDYYARKGKEAAAISAVLACARAIPDTPNYVTDYLAKVLESARHVGD